MIKIYNEFEINKIKASAKVLADVLRVLEKAIVPNVTEQEIEQISKRELKKHKVKAAFLNFPSQGKPYPAGACISVNDQVVHSAPTDYKFKPDDVISVDFGVIKAGYYSDAAFTKYLGNDKRKKELVRVCEQALKAGISQAKPGKHTGDIGAAIEQTILTANLNPVRALTGHGTGEKLHMDPSIFNYGEPGQGPELKPGMVIAIEPIASLGNGEISQSPDQADPWTIYTKDGGITAHFEATVLITEQGFKVLTI